jgi:hypothetical protein
METEKNPYNCIDCNYNCKYLSQWTKHISTELHKTGTKKIRSDLKPPNKCSHCNFESKNNIMFKQHILNEHSTLDERASKFKFYCKTCDYGSFSVDLFNNHMKSKKHVKYINRQK